MNLPRLFAAARRLRYLRGLCLVWLLGMLCCGCADELLNAQIGASKAGGMSGLEHGTALATPVNGRGFKLAPTFELDTNGTWGLSHLTHQSHQSHQSHLSHPLGFQPVSLSACQLVSASASLAAS